MMLSTSKLEMFSPAAAQVVGLAVDEVQEVLVVDPADVAGVVPPVAAGRDGGLGPAPVALEHDLGALGADDDLAVGAAGQLVVVVVEDPDVEVLVVDHAGGVGLVADARRLPRDEAGLGDAVGAGEGLEAEAVAEDVVDLGRHRGRAQQPQAGVGLGGARLRHLGTVDVVGQQVGHGAEGGGDRRPDPVHLRPEVRHRELAVDRRAATEHERAEDRGDDGVEVEQRQRGPHHVVGRAAPADADLGGEGHVVVVAEHAALRRPGGATGVDERAQVDRADVDPGVGVVAREQLGPGRRWSCPRSRWRRRSRPRSSRSGSSPLMPSRRSARSSWTMQHLGARVVELVAQVLALVGGVDRHGDGPGPDDAPPRERALDRVLDQRGHPVTGLHAGGDQGVGDPAGGVVDVGGGDLLAVDVEVLAGGVALEPAPQARRAPSCSHRC